MPSTRDAHHAPVFPQTPLTTGALPPHVRPYIHLVPNPAAISVSGITVASSSLDVLMLLGQQELASKPAPDGARPDRLSRLASHVLKQRLYLPLFPAPSDERNPMPVDVVSNLQFGRLQSLPHILLLPSELAPFAKVVEGGVLCVNPGRLTRKQAGGNYGFLCVHPAEVEQSAAAPIAKASATDSVISRTSVQIVRV